MSTPIRPGPPAPRPEDEEPGHRTGDKDSTRPHEPERIEKSLDDAQVSHPGRTGANLEGRGFGGPLAAGDASSGRQGVGARPNPVAQGLDPADGVEPEAIEGSVPKPRRSGDRGRVPRAADD